MPQEQDNLQHPPPECEDQPDLSPQWTSAIQARLIDWYESNQRELPWRLNRDPYRILTSEMMLVQTTVTAVVPYFNRFMSLFPTVADLAAADEAQVLKAWEGLGYYRRARQLHSAARMIVAKHGGVIPSDPEALRELPGVGRYIAGAILSFAFDLPAPIVEANVQRVLTRLLAWSGNLESSATQARLWQAATRLLPDRGAGQFNQALMELGAIVCTPRAPKCLFCPVSALCRARALGVQESLPVKSRRPAPLEVVEACTLVTRRGRILIVQRAPGRLWEHLWEFPTVHIAGADPAGRGFGESVEIAEGVRRLTGIAVDVGPLVRTVNFSVTKHRVRLDVHSGIGLSQKLKPGPGLVAAIWEKPSALGDYPFGAAGRRLIADLAQRGWPDVELKSPSTQDTREMPGFKNKRSTNSPSSL
jgi:A/G-specific adenine glycosylase